MDPAPARRSQATRDAILAAARVRFAADGYERATIRAIAREAGIDPSMVMRYYGNKEGLFAAASSAVDLRLPDLGAVPREEIGTVLVAHFLERWEEDEAMTATLRVGVTNAAGAERTRAIFREQLGPVVAAVCPDPGQAAVRAGTHGLPDARHGADPLCAAAAAGGGDAREVVAWLAPTVQRYLTAAAP